MSRGGHAAYSLSNRVNSVAMELERELLGGGGIVALRSWGEGRGERPHQNWRKQ